MFYLQFLNGALWNAELLKAPARARRLWGKEPQHSTATRRLLLTKKESFLKQNASRLFLIQFVELGEKFRCFSKGFSHICHLDWFHLLAQIVQGNTESSLFSPFIFFSVEQTQFNSIKLSVSPTPRPFPFPCFICLAAASRDQTVGTVQSAPFSGAQAPDQNLLALFAAGKMTTSKREPLMWGFATSPVSQLQLKL